MGKLGKAGRFYRLTPKAIEFSEKLRELMAGHGVTEEDIPRVLEALSGKALEGYVIEDILESLVEKGFMERTIGA